MVQILVKKLIRMTRDPRSAVAFRTTPWRLQEKSRMSKEFVTVNRINAVC